MVSLRDSQSKMRNQTDKLKRDRDRAERERDEMRGRAVESQRLVSYVEEQVGLNHR